MGQLVQQYGSDPSVLLFKKIDSTLRGHLGAELAAVLKARRMIIPNAVAIMAPAFPANGRTTVHGMHYVHGCPLHETEMWKKEKMQGEARIADMLQGSGLVCAHLDLSTVRGSRESLNLMTEKLAKFADVLVCDAENGADLDAIAGTAAALKERAVWVGSAGLALHLANAAGLAASEEIISPTFPQTSGPVLFVIGSASRTTKHQAAILLSSTAIHGIVVPPEVLLAGMGGSDWNAFIKELCEAVAHGDDVILLCGLEPEVDAEDRARLSDALGEMTARLRGHVGALVASGGETARKVLDSWDVQTLELHGELEKGVPISTAVVNESQPLTVITKAGDFGQPYTLLHCREWLTQTRIS
jgi:4-hydroxythreonine-4-phosphate dehydrogenase